MIREKRNAKARNTKPSRSEQKRKGRGKAVVYGTRPGHAKPKK
jgi:hypothetical protein